MFLFGNQENIGARSGRYVTRQTNTRDPAPDDLLACVDMLSSDFGLLKSEILQQNAYAAESAGVRGAAGPLSFFKAKFNASTVEFISERKSTNIFFSDFL